MPSISKRVRDVYYTLLSSDFNANLDAARANYGLDPLGDGDEIDWAPGNRHFYFGQIDPDQLEESDTVAYPVATIYTLAVENQNHEKYAVFSGDITTGVDVFLSFLEEAPTDFESPADAVEDALVATFNSPAAAALFQQIGIFWNGNIRIDRLPVQMGAENWRLVIKCLLTSELRQ